LGSFNPYNPQELIPILECSSIVLGCAIMVGVLIHHKALQAVHLIELFVNIIKIFGGCWLVIEFASAMDPKLGTTLHDTPSMAHWLALVVLLISLFFGAWLSLPKLEAIKEFFNHNTAVNVKMGNLLDAENHIVIGSNNYLDTNYRIEGEKSIKVQFINEKYYTERLPDKSNSVERKKEIEKREKEFKLVLDSAMVKLQPISTNNSKNLGRKEYYGIGSVIHIEHDSRNVYFPVIAELDYTDENTIKTSTNITNLNMALTALWDYIAQTNSEHKEISIPALGNGLANLQLEPLTLVKYIILSFITKSVEKRIAPKLNIILQQGKFDYTDMIGLNKFLSAINV
jgi:hypothetical protein